MKKQIVSLISLSMVLSAAVLQGQEKRDSLKEKAIEEVVLVNVGYGTQKKSVVTGAISKVTSKDLEKVPNGSVGQMLQGRTSGLTIASNSGAPGAVATIRVRGITTFAGANDPLFVVDGVLMDNPQDVAAINQADIESMEVLKDAASAAIYGVTAAKGVVIITTKKGRKGKMSLNYNGFVSASSPSKVIKVLNATEFATLINERTVNGGGNVVFPDLSSLGVGTDWQKQVFNTAAMGNNHEVSISGANDKSDYFLSFGLQDQEGIVASEISKFNKKTLRINSNHKVNDFITIGESFFYTYRKSVGIGNENNEFGGVLSDAIMFDPTIPVIETDPIRLMQAPYNASPYILRDPNGNPYGMSLISTQEIVNPVAFMRTRLGNYGWSDVFIGNAYAEAKLLEGLKFRSTVGGKKAYWGDQNFNPLYYLNAATNNLGKNALSRNSSQAFDWNVENTLTYNKKFGEHSVNLLLGQGAYAFGIGNSLGVVHTSLPTNNWYEATFNMEIPDTEKDGYTYNFTPKKRTSLFGRINYDYKEKYLLTGIVRRDGSSLFGPNKKYGIFPSVSAGWVVSKEEFWNSNVINNLKLRAGYGVNGNDGTLAPNQYESLVSGGYNYYVGNAIIVGSAPDTLENPDLHWEETIQTNVGVETRLFNDFTFTAEYYKKRTEGILGQVRIPGYVGVSSFPFANIADMDNEGLELELGYRKKLGDLNLSINGNFTSLRNEVTSTGDVEFFELGSFQSLDRGVTRVMKGEAYGTFFGLKTAGIFQNWDEINAYRNSTGALIQAKAQPGDFRWVDANNDGTIDDKDVVKLGGSLPKYTFGATLNLDYKNFDFSVMFQGAAGNKIFQGLRRLDVGNANYQTVALSRWTGEGTSNDYPRLTSDDQNGNFTKMSDFYLENGDYLRLKLLSLGYTIPSEAVKTIGAEKVRLYVTGSNLVTFTKYTGYDPEIGGGVFGIDKGFYPQPRTFLFGLNVQF